MDFLSPKMYIAKSCQVFLGRAVYDEMNDQFLLPLPSLACIRSSSFIRHGNPQTLERWAQEVLAFFSSTFVGSSVHSSSLCSLAWKMHTCRLMSGRVYGCFLSTLPSTFCTMCCWGSSNMFKPHPRLLERPKTYCAILPLSISNPSCCIWKDHPTHRPPCKLVGMEGSAVLTAFQNYHKIGQWKTPLQFAHGIAFTMQHPSCSFSLVSTLTVRTRIHYCNYALAHLGSVSRKNVEMIQWKNNDLFCHATCPSLDHCGLCAARGGGGGVGGNGAGGAGGTGGAKGAGGAGGGGRGGAGSAPCADHSSGKQITQRSLAGRFWRQPGKWLLTKEIVHPLLNLKPTG